MNEISKKRKNSIDLDEDSNSQCKKVKDDKENIPQNEMEEDLDFPDMDFDFFEDDVLDLSDFKRCVVENVEREKQDLILVLKEDCSLSIATCRLKGIWSQLNIKEKDILSVKGVWNSGLGCYIVSTEEGIVVTNPDHLVSGTSVVGSLFCKRKGILSERFRGLDSTNRIMTIGSLIHELFQVVLRRKITSIKDIKAATEELLFSKDTAIMLYSSQMSMEEARIELNKFTIKMYSFVQRYVTGDNSVKTLPDTFSGCIDSIQDIEENFWVPQLGLKGKVDVSVNVKRKTNSQHMPLELKTGKASFSSEHKGQVIIYQMMMSQVGKKVDSGLLLYLREGIMKDVSVTRHSQRDLIMLRNDLSYYSIKQLPEKVDGKITIPELPEPIHHHSACKSCPYNVICSTYLKNDRKTVLSESHPLKEIGRNCLSHLNDGHLEYFIHWTGIIAYEVEESRKENQLKTIWTQTPEKRQKHGRAIIDLEISGKVVGDGNSFIHVFCARNEKDLTLSGFCLGDYLVVSTKNRIAVAAGKVDAITKNSLSLFLERNLSEIYPKTLFILDKYDSETTGVFNMTNLGVLLDDKESSDRMRKIIIDRIKPTFEISAPVLLLTKGTEILSALNGVQRKAVLRAITANDYLLIQGLPGSGKTQTLIALIRLLVLIGKSVLITSHTHSAVDNVLNRLVVHKVDFLRLGSSARISPKLLQHSENHYLNECKTPADVHDLYTKFKVVGVTCLGSAHPLLAQREFDFCLVDEATQVFQASVIRPLLSARTFVLVGDPDQLPPIVRSGEAKKLGANESLFARLDSSDATAVLNRQYRMNKTITKLANAVTYKGSLICANETVANSILDMNKITENYGSEKWLLKCLSSKIDLSVMLLNTGNVFERNQSINKMMNVMENGEVTQTKKHTQLYTNYCEAGLVIYLLKALFEAGVKGESIGIIAPFRAQVDLLQRNVSKQFEKNNVEVNTVDQYQGRDKELIIYCCTKSNEDPLESSPAHDNEILEDQRRLTVAITRSKCKLIVVGDVGSLEKYSPFNSLFENVEDGCKISLENGKMGFSWSTILNYLESKACF